MVWVVAVRADELGVVVAKAVVARERSWVVTKLIE